MISCGQQGDSVTSRAVCSQHSLEKGLFYCCCPNCFAVALWHSGMTCVRRVPPPPASCCVALSCLHTVLCIAPGNWYLLECALLALAESSWEKTTGMVLAAFCSLLRNPHLLWKKMKLLMLPFLVFEAVRAACSRGFAWSVVGPGRMWPDLPQPVRF